MATQSCSAVMPMTRLSDAPPSLWWRLIHAVILPPKLNRTVAPRSSQGTILSKVDCLVLSNSVDPRMLPRKVITISGKMLFNRLQFRALRYAPVEASVPGQSATVLVALALMEGIPVKSSAGKAMNPPPPATEFTAPPSRAAPKRRRISDVPTKQSIEVWFPSQRRSTLAIVIPDFHNPNRHQQSQRDGIGQNDGRGPEPQPVNQPQHHAAGEGKEHSPREVAAALASPRLVHLGHKGKGGQGSRNKAK